MSDLERALLDFAQLFEQLGIRYAIMGGIA